jgi:uncharacterized protein YndB with AHSA1/START domain
MRGRRRSSCGSGRRRKRLEIADGELDLRVGGGWRVTMQEPDGGRKYIAVGTYREVVPPERLVYTHSWETDENPVETVVTVEFHEEGDTTRIVFRQEGFAWAIQISSW